MGDVRRGYIRRWVCDMKGEPISVEGVPNGRLYYVLILFLHD